VISEMLTASSEVGVLNPLTVLTLVTAGAGCPCGGTDTRLPLTLVLSQNAELEFGDPCGPSVPYREEVSLITDRRPRWCSRPLHLRLEAILPIRSCAFAYSRLAGWPCELQPMSRSDLAFGRERR
jgi:hypothetical protein